MIRDRPCDGGDARRPDGAIAARGEVPRQSPSAGASAAVMPAPPATPASDAGKIGQSVALAIPQGPAGISPMMPYRAFLPPEAGRPRQAPLHFVDFYRCQHADKMIPPALSPLPAHYQRPAREDMAGARAYSISATLPGYSRLAPASSGRGRDADGGRRLLRRQSYRERPPSGSPVGRGDATACSPRA